jgi:hypothetical protein
MTGEEFIERLEKKGYSYGIKGGNIIVVTSRGGIDLNYITSLPEGVVFKNGGDVFLNSLKSLPSGIEFGSDGDVFLDSLISITPGVEFRNWTHPRMDSLFNGWFYRWEGNIDGIQSNRLLNKMIATGMFDKGKR